jgi:hypothetical protein
MTTTPILPFTIEEVRLVQGNSIQPYLKLNLNIKLADNGNNKGVKEITLFDIKKKVYVGTKSGEYTNELGVAEFVNSSSTRLYGIGSDANFELRLTLSHFILQRLEQIRDGKDLYFSVDNYTYAYGSVRRDEGNIAELISLQASGNSYSKKYPRSDWIDDLGRTEFEKVELVEIPVVVLANIPLTSDVTRFIHDAERAVQEGRYGDVFGECRKAVEALFKGVEEWGIKQQLTEKESAAIESATSGDKLNMKRQIYFSRLVEHPEKGKRLNALRVDLTNYLSLDPHEAEYKGIDFTNNDASFALRITVGFASNILNHLEYHIKKERR